MFKERTLVEIPMSQLKEDARLENPQRAIPVFPGHEMMRRSVAMGAPAAPSSISGIYYQSYNHGFSDRPMQFRP